MELVWLRWIELQKSDSTWFGKITEYITNYIINATKKLKRKVIFKKFVYLTLNANVLSSTAKNSDGVYLSLKLFWHIVMRGQTLARGLWFGIPGGGLLVVSAT